MSDSEGDLTFDEILFPDDSPCHHPEEDKEEEDVINCREKKVYVEEEVVDKEAIEIYGRSYEDVYLNRDEEGNFAVSFKDPHAHVPSENVAKVSLEDFEILKLVGKGAYGKVHQVRKKDTGKIYAMKVLRKENLIKTNNVSYTITERNILRNIRHPYIASLHFAFQTHGKVYLVMEFLNGGQLLYHMRKMAMFTEDHVKIFAAEMVLALEYLHSLDIIHRDLKPENVLLASDGHLCLADFGLAKVNVTDNTARTFCGTIEYMAPEIIKGSGHGKAADWWSLGILIYDMLTGSPPFKARQRNLLQKEILKGKFKIPTYLSTAANSIIKGLLVQAPENRLGRNGASQIKQHLFFKGICWEALANRTIPAPFIPEVKNGSEDTTYFDKKYLKVKPGDSPMEDSPLSSGCDDHFAGFSYVRDDIPMVPDSIKEKLRSTACN